MFEKIKTIMTDELQLDADITESSVLSEIGVNSLELADLVMHCEDDFGIEVGDDDIRGFVTVGDVVKYVEEKSAAV